MIRMIFFAFLIFTVIFSGVKIVKKLNLLQLETLIQELGFTAGVAMVVIFLISTIVILF